ncbi:MAG: substrate-binding domain-containing protein [Alphaproteobacteria bacterium]|nr:substrate-binding domain-containing protein [Alphaproteobacteria bacterium]
MKTRAKFAAALIFAALASAPPGAFAADLVIVSNQGAIPGLKELGAAFSAKTGNHVTVVLAEGDELEKRLAAGTVDLVSQNPGPLRELVKRGKVVAGTVTPFQLAELGVAVRTGAPKPDIRTPEAYRAALLAAKSIGYSFGCSGTNIAAGIAQLGLTDQLKARTIRTTAGPVSGYVARGEVEIGIQQTNIMVGVPGNDYVGPVPAALNKPCESDVGLVANSKASDAGRAMIQFMISPEAAPLIRKTHAEPAPRR